MTAPSFYRNSRFEAEARQALRRDIAKELERARLSERLARRNHQNSDAERHNTTAWHCLQLLQEFDTEDMELQWDAEGHCSTAHEVEEPSAAVRHDETGILSGSPEQSSGTQACGGVPGKPPSRLGARAIRLSETAS